MTGFRYDELPIFLWPILWFVQNVVFGDVVGTFFFQNFKTRTNVESILNEQGVYVDKTNVDDELLEILLGPSEDDGAKEVFLRVFRGPPGPSPESLLPNLETPVLAIWGSEDPWTPHDGGLHPATNFDKYAKGPFQLILLNGVGHCPHDEAPDQVNTILMDFLANLSTPITSNK
jgi:pimeloyl-ACP methyl ester carboxylesterase